MAQLLQMNGLVDDDGIQLILNVTHNLAMQPIFGPFAPLAINECCGENRGFFALSNFFFT
jgi:hypothetical protein